MLFTLWPFFSGGFGHQAADHRGSPDWSAGADVRRPLRRQSSRVLRQEQSVQAAVALDNGHHEPAVRAASRARPQAQPQVRDRSALQDPEHRVVVTDARKPSVAGRPDQKLRSQVANSSSNKSGNIDPLPMYFKEGWTLKLILLQ